MKKIPFAICATALLSALCGCVAGPYPNGYGGTYYDGAEPFEPVPVNGYDPLFYGVGYYPRNHYRHGYGTYNWGGWHHAGGAGHSAGGFHGGGGHAGGGGGHGGGGHR